jgi:hypothetical protein
MRRRRNGAAIGSTQTRYTYITIFEVLISNAEGKSVVRTRKIMTLSSNPKLPEERKPDLKPFRSVFRTQVPVHGGSRNISQKKICKEVPRRLISTVSDTI